VFVFFAGEDSELSQHGAPERVSRHHALDSQLNDAFRVFFAQRTEICRFQSTRVARVMMIQFVLFLSAGYVDFFRVYDNDVVAGVNVGRVHGLMLATQAMGDFTCQTSERLVRVI